MMHMEQCLPTESGCSAAKLFLWSIIHAQDCAAGRCTPMLNSKSRLSVRMLVRMRAKLWFFTCSLYSLALFFSMNTETEMPNRITANSTT